MESLFQTIVILAATFLVSVVTLLTGFGIGTVLTPAFALLYDAKVAVFLVSVVHLANNVLKFGLFRRSLDTGILKRFGLVSIGGALAGSWLYGSLGTQGLEIALGAFLIVMGMLEFLPQHLAFRFPAQFDYAGGFLSGLMGGLIGNQGAVRAAYLLNYSLSKETFIATATAISLLIDLTRIPVYIYQESRMFAEARLELVLVTVCAFGGTLAGRELLKKIPLDKFRLVIAGFLVLAGIRFLL